MPEQNTKPDPSDASWDALVATDRPVLRSLAKDYDDVNGNGTSKQIAAGLLREAGRAAAIPDDYDYDDDADDDAESDADDGDAESQDEGQDGESDRDRGGTCMVAASALQSWAGHVTRVVDEAKIHLQESGVRTRAVDPANVAMVDASLDAAAFEAFDLPEALIGVNVNRFEDVVARADAETTIHVEFQPAPRNLVLSFDGHEFTLSLIDPDSIRQEPDLPALDLPTRATLGSDDLRTAVQYADDVTDHVRLTTRPTATPTTLVVYGEGDTDAYKRTFTSGDGVEFDHQPDGETTSLYSLDYLKDAVRPSEGEITLHHGQEFPVRLVGDVQDADENVVGQVEHMVAPRIQSD